MIRVWCCGITDNGDMSACQVEVPYDFRVKISQICSELNVDGIRGDIVSTRASKAIAAFEGRAEVSQLGAISC